MVDTISSRRQRCAQLSLAATGLLLAAVGNAEERIADIRQGTNLALALAPNGNLLVIDLLGQLWSLPATGGGATPLTPPGEHARNPRYNPAGDTVVYQRYLEGQWDLWLLDLATNERRALTSSPANEREPDFAPDGKSVVFAADRTGHYCLWSVTLEGSIETQLTEEPGEASYPSVAAHGAIAYAHQRGDDWSIRVLAPSGASGIVHASRQPLSAPSWRPGGGVLIFNEQETPQSGRLFALVLGDPRVLKATSGAEDVFSGRAAWTSGSEFIYAADGQVWRRGLANPVRQPIHLFAAATVTATTPPTDLAWPDTPGERTAHRNGDTRSTDDRRRVFTALGDLWLSERGRTERLTDDSFFDRDPAFWPDGATIVFSSDRTGQYELWRMTLADRRVSQLTFGAVAPRLPAVSPDGRQIAYLEGQSFEPWAPTRLVVRSGQGTERTVVTGLEGALRPLWGSAPNSLAIEARSGQGAERHPNLRVTLVQPLSGADSAAPPAAPEPEPLPPIRWSPPTPPADYVLEVGRLFDGTSEAYRRHVDIHVRAGRIAAVVARGLLPASGEVIDARDLTVIPGLIDVHTHQVSMPGERLGRAWLAYGVTTVREIATDTSEALERAEAWGSGRARGPRLLVSSATPAFDGLTLGFAHTLPEQVRLLAIPRGVEAESAPGLPALTPVGVDLELSPSLAVYQDSVSRLTTAGTTLVTGLAALRGMAGLGQAVTGAARRGAFYRSLFNSAEQRAWGMRATAAAHTTESLERNIAQLVRAGGRLAVGSEAPAVPFGVGTHLELHALVAAGIAGDQALRAATMGGALALGIEQQVGSIEVGKLADFIVLEGDPLRAIETTLDIVAVVQGGNWHDRDSLLVP